MAFAMLKAAIVAAVLITVMCWAFEWRKVRIVAPLQFAAALAATYVIGPDTVRAPYTDDALWLAVVVSALMPSFFITLRLVIGGLAKRGVFQDAHERAQERGVGP